MPSRQAINLYGERPYLQLGLPEARDFAQAAEHSKQLTAAFRADIQKHWDELEAARRKLQVRAGPARPGSAPEEALVHACMRRGSHSPSPHPVSGSCSCPASDGGAMVLGSAHCVHVSRGIAGAGDIAALALEMHWRS